MRSPRSAELVGESLEEFERKYVRRIGVRRSLIEFPNGDCVFFDGARTQMHGLRCSPAPMPHLALLAIESAD